MSIAFKRPLGEPDPIPPVTGAHSHDRYAIQRDTESDPFEGWEPEPPLNLAIVWDAVRGLPLALACLGVLLAIYVAMPS